MVKRTLPGLGLTGFWPQGDDTWKDEMDANLRSLSVIVNGNAKSRGTDLPGSPSVGDIYIVPDSAAAHPNDIAVWDGEPGAESWVYLVPDTGWAFYVEGEGKNYQWDGSAWEEFAGAAGGAGGSYDVRVGFSSSPTSAEIIDSVVLVREVTFAADFAGSLGAVGTPPAGTFDISIQVNASEIGVVSISNAGAFTWSTNASVAQVVPAGGLLTFVAPGTIDAAIENVTFTLLGEL